MKPIIRWTIGDVSKEGAMCLESSIINFTKIYKDRFEYYVCHNNINKNYLNFLNNLKIKCIDQTKFQKEIKYDLGGVEPFWKLLPTRINKDAHEIFIDNDLIIYKELEELEEFLNSEDLIICSEAIKRSYGPDIEEKIDLQIQLNTGFFGIYPKFDFKSKINETILFFDLNKKNFFNEQGCLAHIFQKEKISVVRKEKISICLNKIEFGTNGIHFVGINRLDNCVYYEQISFLEERIKIIKNLKEKALRKKLF